MHISLMLKKQVFRAIPLKLRVIARKLYARLTIQVTDNPLYTDTRYNEKFVI